MRHLLAQGSDGGVGLLRHVEDVARGGHVGRAGAADGAGRQGPEAAQDAEEAALARAVGARNQHAVPLLHQQAQPSRQQLAVRGHHVHLRAHRNFAAARRTRPKWQNGYYTQDLLDTNIMTKGLKIYSL